MNTRNVKVKFKNFRILLDSGCSSTVLMGWLVENLYPEKDAVVQCHTQSGNITTNLKVKLDFTFPILSATNMVTCKFHVDELSKGSYGITLVRVILS